MRGQTAVYLGVLSASLFILQPPRELLGPPLLVTSTFLIFFGYFATLRLRDETYRRLQRMKEMLFFLSAIATLVSLLIILLYNFHRTPGSVMDVVTGGTGVKPFSLCLLAVLSLAIGASAGVSDREGRRQALSSSLFAYLPIISASYLVSGRDVTHSSVVVEGAIGIILIISFEMAWGGKGEKSETLYTIENGFLASLSLAITYLLWTTVFNDFYTSKYFPGLFLSAIISTSLVAIVLLLLWRMSRKV